MENIKRRDFVVGGALCGAAVATAGVMARNAHAEETATTADERTYPAGTIAADFEASVVELDPITEFAAEET